MKNLAFTVQFRYTSCHFLNGNLEKTYKSAEKEAQNMQQKLNNVEQYLGKNISKEQATEHTPRHVGI